jgi:hypothetical protein
MRRGLALVGVALASALVFKSFVAPDKVLTHFGPTNGQISVYGLHIAGSNEMKNFPAELVPLP